MRLQYLLLAVTIERFKGFMAKEENRMIALQCPHCKAGLEVADFPSDGRINCLNCGRSFVVTFGSTVAAKEPPPPPPEVFFRRHLVVDNANRSSPPDAVTRGGVVNGAGLCAV